MDGGPVQHPVNPPDGEMDAVPRPYFSFLTTAYQSEATLPATIRSVVAQTWPDWELVVVDNGMSDAIVEAVGPFLDDARVRLVRQENRGALGGVEAAAEVCTGQHLVVLNSDDTVVPEFCAVMVEKFTAYPSAAAVTCDAIVIDASDGRRWRRSYLQSSGLRGSANPAVPLVLADIIDGPCPYYTAPIRRDVWFDLGGMSASSPRVGDLAFWLRAVAAGHDVRTVSEKLCHYYIRSGSVSQPVDTLARELHAEELEAELAQAAAVTGGARELQALSSARRRIHHGRHLDRARLELVRGAPDEALGYARLAYENRRTVRVAVLIAGLRLSPRLLITLYPLKQRLAATLGAASRHRLLRWARWP